VQRVYFDYLRDLLAPLGLYDMDCAYGRGELEALGSQLDSVCGMLETAEREMCPATAEGAGLTAYEALLPYVPASPDTASRRAAIAALLQIDGGAFTRAALSSALAGCGIPALAEEGPGARTVTVTFPGVRGEPENLAALQRRIEQILPCHLAVAYAFVYLTWAELETAASSWAELESGADSWEALERLEV